MNKRIDTGIQFICMVLVARVHKENVGLQPIFSFVFKYGWKPKGNELNVLSCIRHTALYRFI